MEGVAPTAPQAPVSEQAASLAVATEVAKPEEAAGKMVVNVAPVGTTVNSLKIDFARARTLAEEKKLQFFTTFGILRPKPEEVGCDSFAAGYEVFVKIKGSYHIDYYRKASYRVSIDGQVKEVIILGQTLTPLEAKMRVEGGVLGIGGERRSTKEILLDSEERIFKEFSADILYDEEGREVNQPSVLKADANPEGEKILKTGINVEKLLIQPDALVEKFKPKILQRPNDVGRTVEEVLDISQVSVIYSPFYHVMFMNKRSKEMKQIRIDGISGEVALIQKSSRWETLCPTCGRKISLEEKFCGECGAKLLP